MDIKEKAVQEDIIDLDLSAIKKRRIRLNGDPNNYVELNLSDMNIVSRLNKIYPKLKKLGEEAVELSKEESSDNTEEELLKFATKLETIDSKMSKLIDELFDAEISEKCKDGGTMYDPFNGEFRFEHIIGAFAGLYENSFKSEFAKVKQRTEKHTSKYF